MMFRSFIKFSQLSFLMKCMGISLENLHVDLLLSEHPPEAVQDEKALIFVTESLMMTEFHFEQSYL